MHSTGRPEYTLFAGHRLVRRHASPPSSRISRRCRRKPAAVTFLSDELPLRLLDSHPLRRQEPATASPKPRCTEFVCVIGTNPHYIVDEFPTAADPHGSSDA